MSSKSRAAAILRVSAQLTAEGNLKGASVYRRAKTARDPMLFALVYLSAHLTDADGRITLSTVHKTWAKDARKWRHPVSEPMADRRAEVAPRETGKSTWWFLILPMWAAAHGYVKFAAAFADSAPQAETHLATFKNELTNNPLIRADYPELVTPKTRGRGLVEADRVSLYRAESDFVFAAAGMDSSNLGMKVGHQRPDLIVLDDIEPHEGKYSADLAKKRLDTLIAAILPLNVRARVILAGTVTMQDSIVHQVVKYGRGERADELDWVGEQRIKARHWPAIITNDKTGKRKSLWPEKWPLAMLEAIEHTRAYAKNYANDPIGADGDYWTFDDIAVARELGSFDGITHKLVSLDPAVTTKKSSDYTGIAVIGWTPPPRDRPGGVGRCTVLEVRQVRKSGAELRIDVIETLTRHGARLVLVETNQGGDLWRTILWGLPCKVKTVHQAEKKEVRAAGVLDHYQRRRVGHAPEANLKDYEGQLVAFPRAPHDDMVDAAGSGISYFLDRGRKRKSGNAVGGTNVGYT